MTIKEKSFTEIKNQLLAILIGNISSLNTGMLTGWLAPTFGLLRSPDSPLINGPITANEQSWIGASELIGLFIGLFLFSFAADRYGRKTAIMFIPIPTIIGVILIIFEKSVGSLMAFRAICGLSIGGTFTSIPIFVTEISDDYIRGTFGSILTIFQYSGLIIGNIIGSFVPFNISPFLLFIFPILLLSIFIFVPESPVYLTKIGNDKISEKSIRFYKNCANNEEKLRSEKIKICEMLDKLRDSADNQISIADICNKSAIRGLTIGAIISILSTCTGVVVIAIYASIIFRDSGSTLDPNESTIIMSTIQLIGAICAAIFCDRNGRKILLILSLVGCVIGQHLMATFVYLGLKGYDITNWSWVSVASLSLILFAASMGIAPLRHVVALEVVKPKLRSLASILNNAVLCISHFIVFKFFPTISDTYGLHYIMWSFCILCMFGILFCVYVLKETKGKNVNV